MKREKSDAFDGLGLAAQAKKGGAATSHHNRLEALLQSVAESDESGL